MEGLEVAQQKLMIEVEGSISNFDERLAAGDTQLWDMDPLAEKLASVAVSEIWRPDTKRERVLNGHTVP